QYFDIHQGPVDREAQEIKYILQDIIIIYKSLEHACSDDFREHAEPIIQDLMEHFLAGLHDPAEIQALYRKVFNN
ncbi:MAG: hypothetical protein GWM98_21870, partial [Nitrospinaceae bacterium]|nr:hypothetical protein [Nitrospinaceae bacterium]NIS87073.1 hypothetical protein [Nitrospinaceae bacterium]NIT83927.1 hypothetical protein [Nitrospinaceae bacterium]NIU98296.1 hypothetical protein [Nitrospinaceae bacterium]NIY17336.1 hypothetical protein [Nitrospinaceae bacterium]